MAIRLEQFTSGTVDVVEGSKLVRADSGVDWKDAGIGTGHKFKLDDGGAYSYTIATRVSATCIRLSENYTDASVNNVSYMITRSFTTNRSYARLYQGDSDSADIIREQIVDEIDSDVGAIYDGTATLSAVRLGTPTAPTEYWRMYLNASYELCFSYKGTKKAHVGTLTGSWIEG